MMVVRSVRQHAEPSIQGLAEINAANFGFLIIHFFILSLYKDLGVVGIYVVVAARSRLDVEFFTKMRRAVAGIKV